MATWQRRLVDLSHELVACYETYFDPDNFRRNLNHFLQTSRTITFLIQKQKSHIPNFEAWYTANVLEPWADDPVMQWAKDSRNLIEKEDDLEIQSTLALTLICSYLEETDRVLRTGREELLNAGFQKLRRFAEKILPISQFNSSAIKLERAWIANSFPDLELLSLLANVYSKLYNCCAALSSHLSIQLPAQIPHPEDINFELKNVPRIAYVKLRDRSLNLIRAEKIKFNKDMDIPPEVKTMLADLPKEIWDAPTLENRMQFLSGITERVFQTYHNHASFLFVFSNQWRSMKAVTMHQADRVEKYISWRAIVDMIPTDTVDAVIYVAEVWFRESQPNVFVGDMPIKGDGILMIGLSKDGQVRQITWNIDRSGADPKLFAQSSQEIDRRSQAINFLVPLMRAFGLRDSMVE